jgi:hypothetical protein
MNHMQLQEPSATTDLASLHPDLDRYVANDSHDSDAELVCFFDEGTTNLWHVYVEGKEIFNLLSATVIEALEREYSKHLRKEAEQHNLDLAVARWESMQ